MNQLETDNHTQQEYGYFDNDNYEYVITSPFTPSPWINYLGNDGFYGLISNTTGGYCFYKDPKFRRLTRYRYNNIPVDTGGRYFYLSNNNQAWSLAGRPMDTELDSFECRHGMGYSKFISSKDNIKSELTCFVPLGETAEVHYLTLTNTGDNAQDLDVFSFLEWCLWNAEDDGANFQRNLSTGEVEIEGSTLFHKTEYRERRNHYAFYHVNHDIDGFDTCRDSFLGNYNGLHNPQAVLNKRSSNSHARGFSPIASHNIKLTLAPGETKKLVFILGYCEVEPSQKWAAKGVINKAPATQLIARFGSANKVEAALNDLHNYWRDLLGKCKVKTPSDAFDTGINIWNQYQNMVTFNLSRSASFSESGIGRGMGFRDSNQDTIGFTHMVPEKVRERILDLSATQKADGSAYHQYQPLTKKGNTDIGGNFNDDPLWMVFSTCNYIKESGDYGILDVIVPFNNDDNNTGTHFEHLKRAFDHVVNNLGPHKLPLIGRADWNDCLNLNCFSEDPNESYQTTQRGKSDVAESVMIAGQFVIYGEQFAALCDQVDQSELARTCRKHVDNMRNAVLSHAWDGDWFLRAYDAKGRKVGSKDNNEGKIFIESQGFCGMAQIGVDEGKTQHAMDSVSKHLATQYGIMLQQPAYSEYDKYLGEITSYPPGYKENAGVFCHNNPWIMITEAMLGNGNKSFEYYSQTAPAFLQNIQSLRRSEPYVYAQMVAGEDAATPGQAKNSWLTGTAAWCYYAATQYILGIQPDYDGLRINPCFPSGWDKVEIEREFRGAQYSILIRNPLKISKGKAIVEIDGQTQLDNLILYNKYQGKHRVVVSIVKESVE